jgi:hypothetical protein
MRLIRVTALDRIAMEDRGFGWTIEMQIRAVECGLRIRELPVHYNRRAGGASKISGTVRGVCAAGTIILVTWAKFFLRKPLVQTTLRWLSMTCLLSGAVAVMPFGDFARMGVHPMFWVGACLMSLGYVFSWGMRSIQWAWLLIWAVVLRGVLFFMFPGDDVWRYLWEGRIQNAGFNPYLLAPSDPQLAAWRTPWWDLIQHKEITAIYPPLAQAFLRIASLGSGWEGLKLWVTGADLGVVWLLAWRFGTQVAARYAWCPLVLVSFAGAAHFDSLMLLAMTSAWLLWEVGRWRWAVLAMGMACGLKYVALPLLAWMLWKLYRIHGIRAVLVAAVLAALPMLCAVAWLPLPWNVHHWVPRDFAQYARSADLIPRLVTLFWENSVRLNHIYLVPVALVAVWVIWRMRSLAGAGQAWFLGLLLCSPLVHAWYLTWALPFAAFTGHWGWRIAGMSGLVYYLLQQTAYEKTDWLLSWSQLAWMWAPILVGSIMTLWTKTKSSRS